MMIYYGTSTDEIKITLIFTNKVYLKYLFDELGVKFFAIEEMLSPRMCCKV
jgi:hypothetical protein